ALWRRRQAEEAADKADAQLRTQRAALAAAEQRHAEAVTHASATAARLSLPASLDELRSIRDDLEHVARGTRDAQGALRRLAQAVERWQDRGEGWRAARADEDESEAYLGSVSSQWQSEHERLETLDATIGVAYQEVVESLGRRTQEHTRAQAALKGAEADLRTAVADVTAAGKDCETTA